MNFQSLEPQRREDMSDHDMLIEARTLLWVMSRDLTKITEDNASKDRSAKEIATKFDERLKDIEKWRYIIMGSIATGVMNGVIFFIQLLGISVPGVK